jgi:hypothetical protein
MKGPRLNILIAAIIIGLIAIFIFTFFEYKKVRDEDWQKMYDPKSEKNFGLSVFTSLLKKKLGKDNVVIDYNLNLQSIKDTLYAVLVFDNNIFLSQSENTNYMDCLYKGNHVYLFGDNVSINYEGIVAELDTTFRPWKRDTLYDRSKAALAINFELFNEDTSYITPLNTLKLHNGGIGEKYVEVNSETDSLIEEIEDSTIQNNENEPIDSAGYAQMVESENQTLDSIEEVLESEIIISYKNRPVFQKIEALNGEIYIHSFPELFANVATKNPSVYADHFNILLKELNGKKVFITSSAALGSRTDENPLEILLKNKSLATAYYTILLTLLLFLLFGSKRKQRPVPIIEPIKNTSLEYINTLARLYELQDQNHKLVMKMKDNFYHTMAKRFYVNQHDEHYVRNLAKKSKIKEELIDSTIQYFKQIEENRVCSDEQLHMLNNYLSKIENHINHGNK